MPKGSDEKIILIALIGFAAWLFVGLPLLYLPGGKMIDWGTVPQWLTALIAGGALFAAAISIRSQREIARKRAATDFFLKTEMDHETLESHKRYTKALAKLASCLDGKGEMPSSFEGTDEYWAIRDYLNLHELMAVGILKDVFDDVVCHDFWAGEMRRAYEAAMPLIKYVQAQPGQSGTYIETIKVAKDWEDKRRHGAYSGHGGYA
jgi:hypothetical protein